MKLAVMMSAYNAAPFIADALASLLRQRDAAQLDIIVVNDGSTDATGEIVRRLAGEAAEVRLIETPNQGIPKARNEALDAIAPDTDLVTWLDADDLSPAGRFARDLPMFADPGLDFVYGWTRTFRDTATDPLEPDLTQPYVDVRGIQFGAALLRKSVLDRIGRFDETLARGEDADFLFRLFQLRPAIKVIDDICVYYRRHGSNVTNDHGEANRFFARAILMHSKRNREGGALVPQGFFNCHAYRDWEGWR